MLMLEWYVPRAQNQTFRPRVNRTLTSSTCESTTSCCKHLEYRDPNIVVSRRRLALGCFNQCYFSSFEWRFASFIFNTRDNKRLHPFLINAIFSPPDCCITDGVLIRLLDQTQLGDTVDSDDTHKSIGVKRTKSPNLWVGRPK